MTNEQISNNLTHREDPKENDLISISSSLSQNDGPVPDTIDFRKQFDSLTSPDSLANELQDVVDAIIQRCPDVDWNEDFLSRHVVQAIRYVLDGYIFPTIANHPNISKFDVEAYKLTGKAETTHGDIAIVVSRSFADGSRPITGVGFYEAKAYSLHHEGYPAFSFQQLRRLVTNTPKLSYLLYDKESHLSDSQEWPTLSNSSYWEQIDKQVHARTVDANLVKQYKSLGEAAHFFSQSFGYHFVQKILSGRELDYSRPALETIQRWLKVTRRTTALVVSIAVRTSANDPIYAQLELPGFEKLTMQSSYNDGIYLPSNDRPRLSSTKDMT